MCVYRHLSTVVYTSSANQEPIMPLYLEILAYDHFAVDSALSDFPDASVLGRWTSVATGELVRLVDAPERHAAQRTTARSARILFY
jgi:hypothetical protein